MTGGPLAPDIEAGASRATSGGAEGKCQFSSHLTEVVGSWSMSLASKLSVRPGDPWRRPGRAGRGRCRQARGDGAGVRLRWRVVGRPLALPVTLAGVRLLVDRVQAATRGPMGWLVRVGVEAAGQDHQPLTSTGVLPADWQLIQISPARVAANGG